MPTARAIDTRSLSFAPIIQRRQHQRQIRRAIHEVLVGRVVTKVVVIDDEPRVELGERVGVFEMNAEPNRLETGGRSAGDRTVLSRSSIQMPILGSPLRLASQYASRLPTVTAR